LPAMTADYIDQCCREGARVLAPGAYLLCWSDTFHLCEGDHLRIADVLKCVDMIAWDSLRPGNGYRSRRNSSEAVPSSEKHTSYIVDSIRAGAPRFGTVESSSLRMLR
jgi:hypothetical protein